MRLKELLQAKREEILRVCAKYDAHNVRVFGSVVRAAQEGFGRVARTSSSFVII
jgi:predicted nucleotidyltransferase